MNKDIISILDSFKRYTQYLDSWKENDKDYSMIGYKINVEEMKKIEDCIYHLQNRLEEKDDIIDEAISYIEDHGHYISKYTFVKSEYAQEELSTDEVDELKKILERGKNSANITY